MRLVLSVPSEQNRHYQSQPCQKTALAKNSFGNHKRQLQVKYLWLAVVASTTPG